MIRRCLLAPVAGLLALATGMLTQAAGFDDRCPTPAGSGVAQDNPKVAAIVNCDRAWTAIRAFLDRLSIPPPMITAQ